jgi:prepilin-type N-terminal cleavage/methylation domain-containing protein
MQKQSGFTLIELLLVLAIIGIISAIAIPALLSQRARARDKAATENAVSKVGDLVGQWDKGRESQVAPGAIITAMTTYLANTTASEKNPWAGTGGAPNAAFAAMPAAPVSGYANAQTFDAQLQTTCTAALMGQVQFLYQFPNATGAPGFFGAGVYTQNTGVKSKVSSLE